ncbi:MAG: segregation/condensation protein A [Deltaproteobacteria bacterium]|nr:segregation/condensation protein A [Deltaproteobacteria bacterium]
MAYSPSSTFIAPAQTVIAPRQPIALTDFSVDLEFFFGPLDLLLHLVREQEVAIENVQMCLIAEQYLSIIAQSDLVDLERASEYLVIAATLMSIKSQSLLSSVIEDDPDNYEESEFYEQLRERLKQYELTKARAEALRARPLLGYETFCRQERAAFADNNSEQAPLQENPFTLATAMGELLKRIKDSTQSFLIRMESISVVSFMMKIVDSFKTYADVVSYRTILSSFLVKNNGKSEAGTLRGTLIGSFVAILELGKRGLVLASQSSDDAEIMLDFRIKQQGQTDNAKFSSEFDGEDKVISMEEFRTEAAAEERKEANCG